MTTVSLISPYAPQPISSQQGEANQAASQATGPINTTNSNNDGALKSDQFGQGSGNRTGTGGAQLGMLLERGRDRMLFPRPTSKSIIEAQSEGSPITEFLTRQADRRAHAEEARTEEQAAAREIKAEEAAKMNKLMPNPLPTAPILEKEES